MNTSHQEISTNTYIVTVDGKEHKVVVKFEGAGNYSFIVDGNIHETSYGHPVTEPQGNGVPSAAVICISRGPRQQSGKSKHAWETVWRGLKK